MARSFEDLPVVVQERILNEPLALPEGGPLLHPRPLVRSMRPYRSMADLEVAPDPDEVYDWEKDALCREIGVDVFFNEPREPESVREAKREIAERACELCGLAEICLIKEQEYTAANQRESYGIRGAVTRVGRRRLARKQAESA